ncbi:AMSH/STAMBP protein ubiquitin specific-protease [Mucor velutinosus]|uniref:AMSH/STAMBP protein ubiquitin specific-protease n=1 Tax=Mucor velutinosus TaxID=708070 RepID=A0AAN7DLS8_9FUNG|nr:AMSH/STAMBP protein ubiquitin specific-protease [Mucor velutinosus]
MWCPLLLLLIPTALSFWTSKRRSTLIIKIKEFESALKKTLYDYTATDQSIKWSLQRVPIDEAPCTSVRFCLVIHITELDPEMAYVGEELPSYQTALLNTATTFHPPSYHELTAPPHAVVVS